MAQDVPADDPARVASGVDRLIGKLRDQGIRAGQSEAERLVAEAEAKARAILAQAHADAATMLDTAKAEAARDRTAAQEAMALAARDAVLGMKRTLTERFAGEIGRLVSESLHDPALLHRLILLVAARGRDALALDDRQALEVILPRDAIDLEQLRRRPDDLHDSPLTELVLAATGDVLRAGVTFLNADDGHAGLRVRLTGQAVVLDLSDRAVAAVLMEHVQPRFRALLEGMVR